MGNCTFFDPDPHCNILFNFMLTCSQCVGLWGGYSLLRKQPGQFLAAQGFISLLHNIFQGADG